MRRRRRKRLVMYQELGTCLVLILVPRCSDGMPELGGWQLVVRRGFGFERKVFSFICGVGDVRVEARNIPLRVYIY